MSYRNVVVTRKGNAGDSVVTLGDYISGDNSLVNMHGLVLRPNKLYRTYVRLLSDTRGPNEPRSFPWSGDGGPNPFRFPINWGSLESKSYASFRRKLYSGSASLGVTLGSYKQSREMIVSRYQQLNRRADVVLADTFGKKITPKMAASIHLEVVFGWVPLLGDIHAAATTVIDAPPVQKWIRAKSSEVSVIQNRYNGWSDPWRNYSFQGTFHSTHLRGAQVSVSNPNLWLAERAGLLNPASVAWDLVPWSFVVNMFVNTGQLVNSITDYAGLDIYNGYTLRKASGEVFGDHFPMYSYPYYTGGRQTYQVRSKERSLGAVTRPPLVFKMPKANWELAAIAASLFTQKLSKIVGLVKSTHRLSKGSYTE